MNANSKEIRHLNKAEEEWSHGGIVVGIIATIGLFISLFSKPQIQIFNHHIAITQGIIAPAIIIGSMIWATIEIFTDEGKPLISILIRSISGYIIGMFIGGFLGYEFNFAQYIIIPAYYGNSYALFDLIAILAFTLVAIWDGAWSHNKRYIRRG
uniref:Hypothetical membrane protein n=1 Tax=Thermoplasma acidophilum TaxID=2303 RepID=Q0KKY9_THEAI|nr:hypothetical membrane protein [Thermoplasma acidophilum]